MRHLPTVLRVLLGLVFLTFGLNHFVPFLPAQPPPPPGVMAFVGALVTSHLLTLVKGVEVVAGLLLLGNRFVPLALALLAPIVVGIVWFHAVLAPEGVAIGVFVLALELGLAFLHRDAFLPMLRARHVPAVPASRRGDAVATVASA